MVVYNVQHPLRLYRQFFLPSYLAHALNQMADIQTTRFDVPPLRRTTKRVTRESRSAGANEVAHIKRLDGEVVRLGMLPRARGECCKVWVGRWEKDNGESGGEKVSCWFTTSISLTWLSVGRLESTWNTEVIREDTQGSTTVGHLSPPSGSRLLPRLLET